MMDEAFPRETVTWGDKTLRFGRPNLKTQAAFKEELEREALQSLRRKRDLMDAAEYADAIRALTRDFTSRTYAWGRPECARCIQDVGWYKRLLWHCLVQEVMPEKHSLNPWLVPEMMDKLWEANAYPENKDKGTPAGNHLDDAFGRLMAPDPLPSAPTGSHDQAAA
jgi:hypothetical protein